MPRTQKPTGKSRHDPLHVDIAADDSFAKYGNVSKPGRRKKSRHGTEQSDEDAGEVCSIFADDTLSAYSYPYFQTILDPKASRRIFELARDQQDELDRQDPEEDEDVIEDDFTRPRTHDLELVDEDDEDEDEQFEGFSGDEERELVRAFAWLNSFFQLTLLGAFQEIDEGDIQALDKLHPSHAVERKTLADLIFSKLESGGGQTAIIKASNRCTSVSPLHAVAFFCLALSHQHTNGMLTISLFPPHLGPEPLVTLDFLRGEFSVVCRNPQFRTLLPYSSVYLLLLLQRSVPMKHLIPPRASIPK